MGLGKRKLGSFDAAPMAKQQKNPSYFIPELAHTVNMCDERLPFICLATELSNRNIPHSGLQVEANATSLVLQLLSLPEPGCQHTTAENKVILRRQREQNTDILTADRHNGSGDQQIYVDSIDEALVIDVSAHTI